MRAHVSGASLNQAQSDGLRPSHFARIARGEGASEGELRAVCSLSPTGSPTSSVFLMERPWSFVGALSGPQESLSHSWVTKVTPLFSLRLTKDMEKSSDS